MMKKYFIVIFLISSNIAYSQVTDSITKPYPTINMEEGIDQLMQKNQEINILKNGIEGYCIQIYTGTNREKAINIKYKFKKLFPKITTISYIRENPNWKVKVGKFRTKMEAQKLHSIVKSQFPASFIRETIVPFGEFD